MSIIVSAQGICAGYGDREVLHDASLDVDGHDYIGIIGPNGGGKTTFISASSD